MEPEPVGSPLAVGPLPPLPGPLARQNVPALRIDGSRVPTLTLDGSTVPSWPTPLRLFGYALLIAMISLVVGLVAVPRLTPLRFYAVTSGSMEPALPVGTITVIDTDQRTPRIGEIVAFHPPGDASQVFTHRVVAVLAGGLFKTQGDALGHPDPWTAKRADVVGRMVASVPYAAYGLAVLKVAVLLALIAWSLRFVVRRILVWRMPLEFLAGGVLTGSLAYLLDVVRPVLGGSAVFLGLSRRAVRVDVINTGWVPIRAYSLANAADRTPVIAPDSRLVATLRFPHTAHVRSIMSIKLVSVPSVADYVVLTLIVFSPFLLLSLMALRSAGRQSRIEVSRRVPVDLRPRVTGSFG